MIVRKNELSKGFIVTKNYYSDESVVKSLKENKKSNTK